MIAAAIIGVAGTAYGAYASNQASKKAAGALGGMQQLDLETLPLPETVNIEEILRGAIGMNFQNLPMNFALADRVNQFNSGQALRGYSAMQPYFKQNQELVGRNVASFARGELPSDVVSSIGRGAAERGFRGGFAFGASGGGPGTALGALNLRNLGLTSLDLSQRGTQLAMSANQQAAAMSPNLFDPTGMMLSPQSALSSSFNNANIINDWNRANTQIRNAEASGNTELLNSILEAQTGLRYQAAMNNAQAVQSASNTVAGLAGGGYFGGAGASGAGGGRTTQTGTRGII